MAPEWLIFSNYTVVQLAVRNEFFPRLVHFQKFSTANHNQDSFCPKILDLVKKIWNFEKKFSYVLDVDKKICQFAVMIH